MPLLPITMHFDNTRRQGGGLKHPTSPVPLFCQARSTSEEVGWPYQLQSQDLKVKNSLYLKFGCVFSVATVNDEGCWRDKSMWKHSQSRQGMAHPETSPAGAFFSC